MTTFSVRSSFGRRLLSVSFIFSLAFGLAQSAFAQGTTVIINEVDADQISTDSAEFVELYDGGVGNTDLSDLALVFYNGSDDLSYIAFDLDGQSTDGDGYFVLCGNAANTANCDLDVSPDTNLIQNGADAVALLVGDAVNYPNDTALPADGDIVDAIVYDTNDSDDAGILVLLNAGQPQVNEGGNGDQTGHSNQRCANGAGGARNTSSYTQSAPTPGAANNCSTGPATNVLINEVDADQVSTDSAEFVELYDGGSGNTDLSGLSIVLYNGSDDLSYVAFDLDGQSTGGDGYFVLCANAATTANCDLDVSPDTNLIQNGADAVALLIGDAVNYPNDTALPADGDIVDAIVYDTSDSDDAGILVLLNAGQPQVNEGGNGDQTGHSNQRCANGAGGARNTSSYTQSAPTPGAANNCVGGPVATNVIINEVDADQVSTDSAEFVELYDGGAGNTDLSGLSIVLYNGSDDLSYIAFDLDGQTTDGDGYFVLCGDAANTANCDLDVSPNTDLIQNGEDAVALLVGDAVNYPNDTALPADSDIVDAIVYETGSDTNSGLLVLLNAGQGVINEGGGGNQTGHSNQRCENGTGGARNTDMYSQYPPTPGEENTCGAGGPAFGACADPATPIHDVQGSGPASPLSGTAGVVLEGVVVGDFQGSSKLRGFFLQEEGAQVDADPTTSEGIFVFDNNFGTDVSVGDVVRVQGDVTEYFSLTQLGSVTNLAICGSGVVLVPTPVTLPVSAVTDFEQWEGMLVEFTGTLYVSGNFTQGRYGEVDLSVDAPLDNPTNVAMPGAAAMAVLAVNVRSRIQLDDGSNAQNPVPAPYFGEGGTLRTGDTVEDLTAVLGFAFGAYELHPVTDVNFTRVNTRLDPPGVGGAVRVASFNVLNYFTTLDDSGSICGPLGSQGCRGADNPLEFTQQRAKLVSAIAELDAHVVGLIELENNSTDFPVADLVAGINAEPGAGSYAYIATGPIGSDAIRAGLIYQPAAVSPVGLSAVLDSSVDPLFLDDKNRPVLAQSFSENSSGEVFTVAVNHLKSKGSNCNAIGDPDIGDGQGNCNVTRTAAATALVDWLGSDPTGSGSGDALIIGDLNAYSQEDPITIIEADGYVDLIEAFVGTGVVYGAYSYNFMGESGSLDHALSSPSMMVNVTGAAVWHINADEPSALDYNDYNQDELYSDDQYRSSDHDPLVVGLFGDDDNDGVFDVLDNCPGTVIPESVPTSGQLKPNHWALTDGDLDFDTTASKGKGPGRSYTTADTAGCSCTQIVAAQGLGKGHTKFGCSIDVMDNWTRLVQ